MSIFPSIHCHHAGTRKPLPPSLIFDDDMSDSHVPSFQRARKGFRANQNCACEMMERLVETVEEGEEECPRDLSRAMCVVSDVDTIYRNQHINTRKLKGWTLLLCAAVGKQARMMTYLVRLGADVNQSVQIDGREITPLLIVIERTHNVALARFLIESGARLPTVVSLNSVEQILFRTAEQFASEGKDLQRDLIHQATPLPKPLCDIIAAYAPKALPDTIPQYRRAMPAKRCPIM